MRLWRADMSVPFWYSGQATASAGYFKSILQVGWYGFEPNLGVPYGRYAQDLPSAGDLNTALAKLLTVFTSNWAVAFNSFFLLGFLLCGLSAVWFFRVCGLGAWLAVVLSVLYAVTPYHFLRNESQLFLASYFCVPLAGVVIVRAFRGEALWGRRPGVLGMLTGRGAATALVMVLVAYDGTDYVLFTALLLAFGGIVGVIGSHAWRGLRGPAIAGAVLAGAFLLASLPQIIRGPMPGSVSRGLVRVDPASEIYAFKPASLLLPAPGHRFRSFAALREFYDTTYTFPSEHPALGLVAAAGLVLLLVLGLAALTGWRPNRTGPPGRVARGRTLLQLSVLTWFAFLLGTFGGLGTVVSFLIGFDGWNRISIFIALFALAGVGLALEGCGQRMGGVRAVPALAVICLLIGGVDQSLDSAIPDYAGNAAASASDQRFVDALQAKLPVGSMIFELPWQPFQAAGTPGGSPPPDQLKLWLHSTGLRFSGGGVPGRPESDWPGQLVREDPAKMVHDLSAIGFAGIAVDRVGASKADRQRTSSLESILGSPSLISPDGRYSYLSLAPEIHRLAISTTAAQRAAIAAAVTQVQP